MANTVPFIGLKVKPQDFASRIQSQRRVYTTEDRKKIDNVIRFTVNTMKQNTPLGKTGATRTSIKVLSKRAQIGVDLRSNIIIGSNYPIFKYLDQGTKPSPGRFVPVLGKRLINSSRPGFGMHPGIKALNILDKTQKTVVDFMDLQSEKTLTKWAGNWNNSFR